MAVEKRRYDDPCGVARALGAVGERWALLVVRELLLGPKRFSDLSRGLPGMSQNVLSQRLRELEQAGVVRRRQLGPPVSASVYQLTQHGQELEPVLLALGRWGSRLPFSSSAELSPDALILALRTTFDPARAAGAEGRFGLELNDDRLILELTEAGCHVNRAEPSAASGASSPADQPVRATLWCDPATLRALVFGGLPMDEALHSGALTVTGDELAVERLLHAFPRPSVSGN